MANRNSVTIRVHPDFYVILKRKSTMLSKQLGIDRNIGLQAVTKRLSTPDFEKLIDDQLSRHVRKLLRFR